MNDTRVVMITGAAGFIGSHLCEHFLKNNWEVIGFDNFLSGSYENISHLSSTKNFTFIEHDITEPLPTLKKISLLLHFACPASPVDYLKYPIETMKVNSIGTLHTLQLAKKYNARYVLASTSEIYGDPLEHPQTEEYWGNVNPVGPRSVYDEGKRFSEALVMSYFREFSLDARIIRIFNTYGPRMRANDGRVIPNFINQILQQKEITVYGNGKQTRSFCYISDLVEGIGRVGTLSDLQGSIFNLGNPTEYSILEFLAILKKQMAAKNQTIFQNLPTDDPKRRKPNISKAKKYLQWQPQVQLDQGLKQTILYFQNAMK